MTVQLQGGVCAVSIGDGVGKMEIWRQQQNLVAAVIKRQAAVRQPRAVRQNLNRGRAFFHRCIGPAAKAVVEGCGLASDAVEAAGRQQDIGQGIETFRISRRFGVAHQPSPQRHSFVCNIG